MHLTGLVRHSSVLLIAIFCSTAIASAALSDHPVVTGITGPDTLDNGYGPTGSYTFTASVAGGSPPYTYKWMNPPGIKTLFEGKEYASVTIPADQLRASGGPGHYAVWLTVTDSAGKEALWQKEGGAGSSSQYSYSLTYTETPHKGWTVETEPATFPVVQDTQAPAAAVATNANCQDSKVLFSTMKGQVMVAHSCMGGELTSLWKPAKLDTPIYVGDHIRTEEDASAILSFSDMSSFILKPETEIIIEAPVEKESKFQLITGKIWANIKKMAQDGTMEIDSDQAVCGIKGTTFVLSATSGQTVLVVIEGTVSMTGKADKKMVQVSTGQMAVASDTALGDATPADTAPIVADWEAEKAKLPAAAATQKSGADPALAIAGAGIAAAGLVLRRMG